ncbi:hypothetical protein ACQ856_09870 [Mycolicibacterium psychrotolerans]|uniref:hypothetical protein n=1 Tax=Mycolicibacterium psychrotolerans TaxID=216929 RepID=UPI003D66984F
MNLNDILADEIDAIQPADLEAVLRSLGWKAEGGIPSLASQWLKTDDPHEPSVLVPLNRQLADYRIRLWEALTELERIHGDQGDMIITNLLLPGLDEVTNQKEERTIAGSIPWTAGEKQITAFREILVASAKASEVKERYYGKKRRSIAIRYLSQVRMGQTKVGSYVITALSPVGAIPIVEQKEQYGESLGITGRQVIETLAKSLETLRTSTVEFNTKKNDAVFEEAVTSGVSLDLVRAVAKNLGNAESAATTIQWTSRIQAPQITAEIVFDRSHAPALTSAIAKLTEVVKNRQATIIGRVTGLNRYEPGSRGTVVLNVLDGPPDIDLEFVSLVLDDTYDQAIEFHRAGQLVRVAGELSRDGRVWELTNVTSLQLMTTNEITDLVGKFEEEVKRLSEPDANLDLEEGDADAGDDDVEDNDEGTEEPPF